MTTTEVFVVGLFHKLVRSLLGKQQVTPIELGEIIADRVLTDLGRVPSPFLSIDPIFKRLDPAVQKRLVLEKTVALATLFTHFFLKSCNNAAFGLLTYRHYAGALSFRLSANRVIQEILGFANQVDAERRSYEELADAFYDRGNYYLGVLKTCPDDNHANFVRAHQAALGLPFREDSNEFWASLSSYYRGKIAQLWEVFTPCNS